jgi:hypothetical protein
VHRTYVRMYVCMYVCMYACMRVCVCVCARQQTAKTEVLTARGLYNSIHIQTQYTDAAFC